LHSSPSIAGATKPREMKWAGHEACMDEKRNAYKILEKITFKKETIWKN
jgi:hypothetical protein